MYIIFYLINRLNWHRMKLCRSVVNWMITEWSGKVTEWHTYAIQSHFSYLSVTFQLTEWQRFILWIPMTTTIMYVGIWFWIIPFFGVLKKIIVQFLNDNKLSKKSKQWRLLTEWRTKAAGIWSYDKISMVFCEQITLFYSVRAFVLNIALLLCHQRKYWDLLY